MLGLGPMDTGRPSNAPAPQAAHWRDLSREQWRSGAAAWLGWTFDGLDMHLYTLVAAPFVAQLLGGLATTDPRVGRYGSIIQAAFLLGWALGGGFFGRIGDRLGRARALSLTVLTYAAFTGLSFFAGAWWHLMIFRFLAALGIGGEWAVGASLLSETWPRSWRPWVAAVLQTGVNVGILLAVLSNYLLAAAPPRCVFLVGVLPALLVFWIRRAVPEPAEWRAAKAQAGHVEPSVLDLFRGASRPVTLWVIVICGVSLSAHWAFMFWHQQHLRNLPGYRLLEPRAKEPAGEHRDVPGHRFVHCRQFLRRLARAPGRVPGHHRLDVSGLFPGPDGRLWGAPGSRRPVVLVPAHRVLPRRFCSIHDVPAATLSDPPAHYRRRILLQHRPDTAAAGTVFFGLFSRLGDHRSVLLYAGILFLPSSLFALFLPRLKD